MLRLLGWLKTGAKIFYIPIGWAWLAYDVYKSLTSSGINYLAEAKKINSQIFIPLYLYLYREDGPEFNKPLIGNLNNKLYLNLYLDIKYSIMEETLKTLGNAKDIEDFKKKVKALRANTSISNLEKNKAVMY